MDSETELVTTQAHALVKAEIDQQIATAKQYPRDIKVSRQKLVDLSTLDAETAEACGYVLPRTDANGKKIAGPSVRLAEMAVIAWGNIRAAARIVEVGRDSVIAEGVCHDLESNASARVSVSRSIVGRNGKRYPQHLIDTTCNAACSIAYRNAVFKVVPQALTRSAYQAALELVRQQANASGTYERMVAAYGKAGVRAEDLAAYMKSEFGSDDLTEQTYEHMRGLLTSIIDGDAKVDDIFGVKAQRGQSSQNWGKAHDHA